MSNSFQNEIPKARVNITLDVETEGSRKKKELPMKLLMMGDYSNGKAKGPVAERERINIHKDNFNQVMSDLAPEADLDDLGINLKFNNIKDFNPERIAEQVPQLKKLMAMRNVLKDLKASVLDNQQFRKELETILKDDNGLKSLTSELNKIAPIDDEKE